MSPENEHVLDYVDDYLHDALSRSEAERVEAHCDKCPICRTALAEAHKRFDALHRFAPAEAPESLIRQTIERVNKTAVRRTTLWRVASRSLLAVAATAALIIGGFHAYYANLRPSPYDLRILGQSEMHVGSTAWLRVGLLNRAAGAAVSGAPIEVRLVDAKGNRQVTLASFKSGGDEHRGARLDLPDWQPGAYELRIVAQTESGQERISHNVTLKRSWKLMLSTDKPRYQPGQTIHLRALALARPDLKPAPGQEVVFTIADPRGNVIFKQRDVTSRFGITSADCPLATEIIEGDYRIECAVADTASSRSVRVEKYVLPKFKVALDLDRPFYAPGEAVKVSVQADYFFGQPVAGGSLSLDVQSADGETIDVPGQPVKTDDNGAASVEFRLPQTLIGREQDSDAARLAVTATVTDSAGQTHSAFAGRLVAAEPIRLEVIPESGTLVVDQPNVVYIHASYLDGRPAQVRLAVSGIGEEIETNSLGAASLEITPRKPALPLTVKATDDEGRTARRTVELACGARHGDFLLRPDKAVYDGGQTMTLTALGIGDLPVFVDIVKDGQTMLTETVQIENGAGAAHIDLPPEIFGAVQLAAWRQGRDGLPVRKSRTIYIRRAGQLQVQTELDRQQYRPGERASLKITLLDQHGKPAPGAVSLAAVDEAVYSVLNQRPGLEQTYFTLEEELLEPVYQIYNWSPREVDSQPGDSRLEFEQALFASTAAADKAHLTLSAESFPAKARKFERQRDNLLERVVFAWWSMAGALVMCGLAFLAFFSPKGCLITGGVLAACSVVGMFVLMMAAVKSSSPGAASVEAADMAGDMFMEEQMEQLGVAMLNYHDTYADAGAESDASAPPRLRQWFPETLLWRPELITDDSGIATIDIELADSITSWRVSASAIDAAGRMGGGEQAVRVFQPFFVDLDLPVALTRLDEVSVPIVVYNYLDQPQTVTIELTDAAWFRRLGEAQQSLNLELSPNEVRSLHIPIRAIAAGKHELQVTATAGDVADAVKRSIEVVPNGRRVEQVQSGVLGGPVNVTLSVPEQAVEGSVRAIVKLHPSAFSQVVEGLDAIFQMPHGCFEQTSSTTYPNVLALDYLRRTGKSAPQIEAKATQYIQTGYQRLVSFEVKSGGFDWFGNPPGHVTLTAYGLMEFEDMNRVYEVEPKLIERTRAWLLSKRSANGAWPGDSGMLNDGLASSVNRGDDLQLASTAYIAWAVFGDGQSRSEARPTLSYLTSRRAASLDDPYLLALLSLAIASIDDRHASLDSYLDRLLELRQTDASGKQVWWNRTDDARTMFYGNGRSGDVEATATAVLALLKTGRHVAAAGGALNWITSQKDARGTWYSTQATVLALKALTAAAGKPLGGEKPRQFALQVDGETVRQIDVSADQADVMQQIDLSDSLAAGEHQLTLHDLANSGSGYQVAFHYYLDDEPAPPTEVEPFTVQLAYDRGQLKVDETVSVTATVVNNMQQAAPMVIVDLPIPAGFAVDAGSFDKLVADQKIAKYQLTPRQVIIYLRQLPPGASLVLPYRLQATMPVKTAAPDATVYEYYNPDNRGSGGAIELQTSL